jgi:hypothetical protein
MPSRGPLPRCRHCAKAIKTCLSRPLSHACPPGSKGYVHGSGKHRCRPQAGSTYAEPEGAGDG